MWIFEGESLCRSIFSSFSLQPGYSCSTKRAGVGPVSTEDTYFRNLSRITIFCKPVLFGYPHSLLGSCNYTWGRVGSEGRCNPLFPYFWSVKHFLLGNDSYIYKESEILIEDSFQKKKLMNFVGLLGYTRGLAPLDEDDKKCLECLIDVSLLVGSGSHKGHRAVLGKLKIFSIFYCWFNHSLCLSRDNDYFYMQI